MNKLRFTHLNVAQPSRLRVSAVSRRQTIFLIAFSFACLFTPHCFAIADQDGPKIGEVPPALKLTKTLQGPAATDLSWEKLKGKVVVLEFWAT